MRVVINREQFRRLVGGQPISIKIDVQPLTTTDHQRVEIILADMGFGVMRAMLADAEREQNEENEAK